MSRVTGTFNMGSNIEARMDAPFDARTVTKLKADLTDPASYPYFYEGLTVYVEEDKKKYTLVGPDPTDINNWKLDSASGTSGGGELAAGLEAQVDVGGISVGKTYAAGDSLEDILRDMLYPLTYPTLTDPSVSLSTSSPRILEVGSSATVNLTATPNYGSINPPFTTSGKRAGDVTAYELVGVSGSQNTTGTWTGITVDGSNTSFTAKATFSSGPQPKDSHKNDYDNPYPGGDKTSTPLTFTFVYCMYSNTTDITTITKHAPEAMSVKEKILVFPPQTVADPGTFLVPASWTVKSVEVLNEFSGKYEDCASEYSITDVTRPDAAGTDVAYKKYTDNRGYKADSRTIKVTIA